MGEIELLELAERVEGLDAWCTETDGLIVQAAYEGRWPMACYGGEPINYDPRLWMERHDFAPTASLDAAMALVPEGWHLHSLGKSKFMQIPWLAMLVEVDDGAPYSGPQGNAATPAIALCAAALRARASITRTTGDGDGNGLR